MVTVRLRISLRSAAHSPATKTTWQSPVIGICMRDTRFVSHSKCDFPALCMWYKAINGVCTCTCLCCFQTVYTDVECTARTSAGDPSLNKRKNASSHHDVSMEEDQASMPLLSADNATYISTSQKQKPTPLHTPAGSNGVRHMSNNNGSPLQKRTADAKYENIDYVNQA